MNQRKKGPERNASQSTDAGSNSSRKTAAARAEAKPDEPVARPDESAADTKTAEPANPQTVRTSEPVNPEAAVSPPHAASQPQSAVSPEAAAGPDGTGRRPRFLRRNTGTEPDNTRKSNQKHGRGNRGSEGSGEYERRYYKMLLWTVVGVFALAGIAGFSTLMVALRGPETLIVPDVRNLDFVDAVEVLQDRGLLVRVQQRFFSDPNLRGKVVEQTPTPGGLIRAGRYISLTVSRGAVIDQVGDFIGRSLEDVRQELTILAATYGPLLEIDDSGMSYIFDDSAPGTILDQDPAPGTNLTGLTALQLLVSRGPEVMTFPAPDFTRVDYQRAIQLLAARNQPFEFVLGEDDTRITAGYVMSQDPGPGTDIQQDTVVTLTVQPIRSVPRNQIFGMFERTLPQYSVPVDVTAEILLSDESRQLLFSMKHPGGRLSFPYVVPEGSQIVISAFDAEVIRYIVTREQS